MRNAICAVGLCASLVLLSAHPSAAQGRGRGGAPGAATVAAPVETPRTVDGKPDLSGLWMVAGRGRGGGGGNPGRGNNAPEPNNQGVIESQFRVRDGNFNNIERDAGQNMRASENPPWYKAEYWEQVRYLDENGNKLDPGFGCVNPGLGRIGVFNQVIQLPNQLVLLYQQQNTFRIIPTDGRPLRKEDEYEGDRHMGYSVGHWEGDTMVIETVDVSVNTWLGWAGWFHSPKIKFTERMRRTGNTFAYDLRADDPDVLLRPWVLPTRTLNLNTTPGAILNEQAPCIDRDQANMATNERG